MRKYLDIVPEEPERFKTQLCLASQDYGVSVILDSNDFDVPEFTPTSQKYAFIAGLGSVNQVLDDLSQVKLFHNQYKDWMLRNNFVQHTLYEVIRWIRNIACACRIWDIGWLYQS